MVAQAVSASDPQLGRNLVHGFGMESAPVVAATNSTWVERLLMNLLSYSIVLIPIAFIVIATRSKLLPGPILSNALVQRFVYGTTAATRDSKPNGEIDDDQSLLDNDATNPSVSRSNRHPQNTRSDNGSKTDGGTALEFLFCLVGLQVSYLIWGLLQEKIMTTEYPVSSQPQVASQRFNDLSSELQQRRDSSISSRPGQATVIFNDSQFLVFINRMVAFVAAILAFVYTRHRQSRLHSQWYIKNGSGRPNGNRSAASQKPSAPLYKFVYSSLSNILSSWCQYEALKYVNFPTQCLSKSCKVIPVMLMSKLLMSKRYPYIDYLCALLLAVGMFIFMLNQPIDELNKHNRHGNYSDHLPQVKSTKGDYSLALSGFSILTLYLTFDSFTSNWQQNLYSRYDISNWQMMAASNFYSIFLTLTSLHQLGNLRPAFDLLASSRYLMRDCLIMSLMSSIGQMFVYYTIKRFGSVIFAVIMTLRQFLSILLSCTIYKHHLNAASTVGLIMVFLVVGFQVWYKSARRKALSPPVRRSFAITHTTSSHKDSFSTIGRQLLSNVKEDKNVGP